MFNNFQALFQRAEMQKRIRLSGVVLKQRSENFESFALLLYLFTLTSPLFENPGLRAT